MIATALAILVWATIIALLMTGRNLEHAYFALRKVRQWVEGKPIKNKRRN